MRSADLLNYLNWDNLALRRDKRLSILMYDTINNNVPKYFSDLFSLNSENKSIQISSKGKYIIKGLFHIGERKIGIP